MNHFFASVRSDDQTRFTSLSNDLRTTSSDIPKRRYKPCEKDGVAQEVGPAGRMGQ